MRIAIPVLVFGIALSCGPAFADGDGTGAMGQLDNATSGNQTLQQTYGDQGPRREMPEALPLRQRQRTGAAAANAGRQRKRN